MKRVLSSMMVLVVLLALVAEPGTAQGPAPTEPITAQAVAGAASAPAAATTAPLLPGAAAAPPAGFTAGEWRAIQDHIRQAEYHLAWHEAEAGRPRPYYWAPNRGQDFSVAFDADGLSATGCGADGATAWEFGLALTSYGAPTGLSAQRARLEYRWGESLTEWYENRADGVEHGLRLAAPPAGTDGTSVALTFALRGSLRPRLEGDGQRLRLQDASARTVLLYDHLRVYDAAGKTLPARLELAAGASRLTPHVLRLTIETASAVYPLTVDPLLHSQAARLTASDAADDDYFGYSVAIGGDTLVVGAYGEDGAGSYRGAVYLFARNQGGADNWGEVRKLTASDAENNDWFGRSVAIGGDTVVVGAYLEDGAGSNRGAAYLFARNQGGADNWGQVAKLTASDATDYDWFGYSVVISGDTVVVGAYGEDGAGSNRGAAYLFARNQGGADNWGQVRKLSASDAADNDYFGFSVAISGDTVVVGAYGEDGAGGDRGAAYLFARNQGGADNWGQVCKLTASDAADYDYFGVSVVISGDTVVVGAYREDGAGSNRGAAYLFARNQGGASNWGQVAKLTASDAADDDSFGRSVAIGGDTVVVGAEGEDGAGSDRGAAYLFARNQGGADNWGEVARLTASDAADDDYFGHSVAISGDTVVVGAYGEDGAGSNRGAAYLFAADDGVWQEVAIPCASDAADGDHFGSSVAISGDTVVVGAPYEGGAGSERGAAYLFARNQGGADNWGQVRKLTASDAADDDYFGHSVAISGDTVVVGAEGEDGAGSDRGAAYLFARNQGGADNWGEVTRLTASDAENGDDFGWSVAIGGDTVVVGAPAEDGAGGNRRGAAYLFARNQGGADNWGQVRKLTASDAADDDEFGWWVAISGDTVVVGAHYEDGAGGDRCGAAYLFARNQGGADNWGQVRKLTASDAADNDYFGWSVAIGGDTVVVGAPAEDGAGSDRGAAYLFARNQGGANNWGQVRKLTASDAENGDWFGSSVAIGGDTVVVGAPEEGGAGSDRGAAYLFARNQGGADNWGQVTKLSASDAANYDYFSRSAISGDTVVVGAYGENGAGSDRGAAYVFELQPSYRVLLPLVCKNCSP